MRTLRTFHFHPAVLFLLFSGCGSSNEPGSNLTHTYVLRRIAGDPLPALVARTEIGETRLYADTIRLVSDGTGSRSERFEFLLLNGDPSEGPQLVRTPLHYRFVGGQIEIDFDCPPMALCVAPPHMLGAVGQGELQVRWGPHLSGREPLEYVQAIGD